MKVVVRGRSDANWGELTGAGFGALSDIFAVFVLIEVYDMETVRSFGVEREGSKKSESLDEDPGPVLIHLSVASGHS
jgi:hypothetical protein